MTRHYGFYVSFTVADDTGVEFTDDDIRCAIVTLWPKSNPRVEALASNGKTL